MKRPGRMMRQVLKSAMQKPATLNYPAEKLAVAEHLRGKLKFHAENCIGCRLCMKDCPTNAITIRKAGEKQFEADIDLGRCIYCAQCVDSCPKDALTSTTDFELAQLDREKLKTTQRRSPVAESAGETPSGEPDKKA